MEKRMRSRTKKFIKSIEAEGHKQEDSSRLPGAYIRTLVKQLTSSQPYKQEDESSVSNFTPNSTAKFSDGDQTQQPTKEIKKQVRRRSHTSKPYQQRLINMAEARKEIVTALKFHRAAIRQTQAETNPRGFQDKPSAADFYYPKFEDPSIVSDIHVSLNSETPPGLNLNFHHLGTQDMQCSNKDKTSTNSNKTLSKIPGFLPSSSSSFLVTYEKPINIAPPSSLPIVPGAIISTSSVSQSVKPPDCRHNSQLSSSTLHRAMDDEEMAEIRSLGEQHEMQWNDTVNLVNSAWWFRFLNSLEVHEGNEGKMDGLFDKFMEIPSWLDEVGSRRSTQTASPSDDNYQDFLQDGTFDWIS